MSQVLRAPCGEGTAQSVSGAAPCPETARPLILASAVAASSMAFIDGSAVTVALPAMRADLDASLAEAQWIMNIYVLALAAFTLIGGAAADRFGRRRVYVWSIVAFAAASLACAAARSPDALIAARAVKGLAGAFLAPAALAVIGAVYPKESRGRALGVWASASALTAAIGPIVGGLLVEHAHWSWIFALNVPVAVIALALAWRTLPESRAPGPHGPLDLVGAALAAAAFGCLAYGLVSLGGDPADTVGGGDQRSWTRRIFFLGCVGLVAFLSWERRARDPMAPLGLFANRVFSGITALTVFLYAALSVLFFALPFELMDARGWTATVAGLAFLPFTLAVGLLSRSVGGLSERIGARPLLLGGSVAALGGFAMLGLIPAAWGGGLSIAAPMGLLGFGFALAITPLTAVALAAVPEGRGGVASGINNAAARAAGLGGGAAAAALLTAQGDAAFGWAMALASGLAGIAVLLAALAIPSGARAAQQP